jgi:predicted permease
MLTILNVTGPIYLSIAAGFLATRTGFFTKEDSRVLSKFVLNFALPAMLFNALAKRSLEDILHPGYLLAYALGSLCWGWAWPLTSGARGAG